MAPRRRRRPSRASRGYLLFASDHKEATLEFAIVGEWCRGAEDPPELGEPALLVYDPATATSDFVLFDAWHVDQAPVAVVRLPQRVPQGLHGSWLAK